MLLAASMRSCCMIPIDIYLLPNVDMFKVQTTMLIRNVLSLLCMGPRTGGGGNGAVASPTLIVRGRPLNFDEKNTLFFGIGSCKIKWTKSEDKLEFGGR